MKTFIVFLGLLIINVNFLVYQGDLVRYIHEQTLLKAVAEECAAGAALLLKEEEFSGGRIVFDQQKGKKYGTEHLNDVMESRRMTQWDSCECIMSFEDDEKGYGSENHDEIPAVSASVRVAGKDLFRLPFLHKSIVERRARYEVDRAEYKK